MPRFFTRTYMYFSCICQTRPSRRLSGPLLVCLRPPPQLASVTTSRPALPLSSAAGASMPERPLTLRTPPASPTLLQYSPSAASCRFFFVRLSSGRRLCLSFRRRNGACHGQAPGGRRGRRNAALPRRLPCPPIGTGPAWLPPAMVPFHAAPVVGRRPQLAADAHAAVSRRPAVAHYGRGRWGGPAGTVLTVRSS